MREALYFVFDLAWMGVGFDILSGHLYPGVFSVTGRLGNGLPGGLGTDDGSMIGLMRFAGGIAFSNNWRAGHADPHLQ